MSLVAEFAKDLTGALALDQEPIRTVFSPIENAVSFAEAACGAVMGQLANPSALSTNVRLLEDDKEIPRAHWAASRIGPGDVIHTELKNAYIDRELAAGKLLVIDSVDECNRMLMLLRESLEYRLRARAWINAYITANSTSNFGLHSDTHDTVIVQILGRKRWQVDSHGRGVLPAADMNLTTYELTRGDALAIGEKTAHIVSGIGELTAHLTIGFDRSAALPFHLDFAEGLLGRKSVPISEAESAYGKANTRERRTGSSLPFRMTGDLRDCRRLRWASRLMPMAFTASDDALTVLSMGTTATFEGKYRCAVEALLLGHELELEELRELSCLTSPALRDLLVGLLEQDLIITAY